MFKLFKVFSVFGGNKLASGWKPTKILPASYRLLSVIAKAQLNMVGLIEGEMNGLYKILFLLFFTLLNITNNQSSIEYGRSHRKGKWMVYIKSYFYYFLLY